MQWLARSNLGNAFNGMGQVMATFVSFFSSKDIVAALLDFSQSNVSPVVIGR